MMSWPHLPIPFEQSAVALEGDGQEKDKKQLARGRDKIPYPVWPRKLHLALKMH